MDTIKEMNIVTHDEGFKILYDQQPEMIKAKCIQIPERITDVRIEYNDVFVESSVTKGPIDINVVSSGDRFGVWVLKDKKHIHEFVVKGDVLDYRIDIRVLNIRTISIKITKEEK